MKVVFLILMIIYSYEGKTQRWNDSTRLNIEVLKKIDSILVYSEYANFIVKLDENQNNLQIGRLNNLSKSIIINAHLDGLISRKKLRKMRPASLNLLKYPVFTESWLDTTTKKIKHQSIQDSILFVDSVFNLVFPNRLKKELSESENNFFSLVLKHQSLYSTYTFNFPYRVCFLHRIFRFRQSYFLTYLVQYIKPGQKSIFPGLQVSRYGLLMFSSDSKTMVKSSFNHLNGWPIENRLLRKLDFFE